MENINDYAVKYANEVVSSMLEDGMTAIGGEMKKLLYDVAKAAYARGFRDSQSVEWQQSIKEGRSK